MPSRAPAVLSSHARYMYYKDGGFPQLAGPKHYCPLDIFVNIVFFLRSFLASEPPTQRVIHSFPGASSPYPFISSYSRPVPLIGEEQPTDPTKSHISTYTRSNRRTRCVSNLPELMPPSCSSPEEHLERPSETPQTQPYQMTILASRTRLSYPPSCQHRPQHFLQPCL